LAGWSENLTTMPAELALRVADAKAGVSPAALRGAGSIGPKTTIDFALNAPTRGRSPFGEVGLSHADVRYYQYRGRVGDELFGFSNLTSSMALGRGLSLEKTEGAFVAGGFVETPRTAGFGPAQAALMLGTRVGEAEA